MTMHKSAWHVHITGDNKLSGNIRNERLACSEVYHSDKNIQSSKTNSSGTDQ